MKLKEIFDQLTQGELSQISFAGGEAGSMTEAGWGKVLPHINLGLMALFKRFRLKEGKLRITLIDSKTDYKLHSSYSVNSLLLPLETKYIQDTVGDPFLDDILKVEQVITEDSYELDLNNRDELYSIMTPNPTLLRVPAEMVPPTIDIPDEFKTSTLDVVYRASHPIINLPLLGDNPGAYEVNLPYTHLEALLLFVASRVNNPIGMTNEFHAGNNYAAKYEKACLDLELQNYQVDQGSQGTRFQRNGWV